ncbi:acyl-CoA dehydrogenase family protein [Robbsia andropogonis]|uniref:acyl-CoA dehydrogenase family protein n=1 Tax=Robbsia andropogonis TaxID=28092 RepID=UPI001F1D920A|nr:acyl-CoA dehydrogenase family protein [Robbsia andropogonis]
MIAPFRPIFDDIRQRSVERERTHTLLHDEIQALRHAGFTRFRLPKAYGGFDATLPEFFAAAVELGRADPNVINALRSHFGFTEEVLDSADGTWRDTWLDRLGAGELSGSGFSETGENPLGTLSTQLRRRGDKWVLNGEKYYTSGSLYADWINLSASDETGTIRGVLVPTRAPGVEILDDWEGFGQQLTASGTALFHDVAIDDALVKPHAERFRFAGAWFQLIHIATLAGIGQAAATDLSSAVAARKRVYAGRTNFNRPSEDPQILQIVGRIRSASYVSTSAVLKAAEALQRVVDLRATAIAETEISSGDAPLTDPARLAWEAARTQANVVADVEVSQTVTVVTDLILSSTTHLFDALGASATKRSTGLDRHWRNARTIASHNPRVYHDRIVGDYAVNGAPPPIKGGIGVVASGQSLASRSDKEFA